MSRGDLTTVKICLIGNSQVGKTGIAKRFVYDTFSEKMMSTVGTAFMRKELVVKDEVFDINLWDTAGQERFRSLAPLTYRNAAVVMLVYDVTDSRSFECLQTVWVPDVRANAEEDVLLVLVGNKVDLIDSQGRAVAMETARVYSHRLQAIFLETSAKTGQNVEAVFTEIALRVMRQRTSRVRDLNVITLPDTNPEQDRRKRRCPCKSQ